MQKPVNRHIERAYDTLNKRVSELGKDDYRAFFTYQNGELSLLRLIVCIVRNRLAQAKAVRAYNRTVSIKAR